MAWLSAAHCMSELVSFNLTETSTRCQNSSQRWEQRQMSLLSKARTRRQTKFTKWFTLKQNILDSINSGPFIVMKLLKCQYEWLLLLSRWMVSKLLMFPESWLISLCLSINFSNSFITLILHILLSIFHSHRFRDPMNTWQGILGIITDSKFKWKWMLFELYFER